MTLAESLNDLVAYGLFPAWLAAGAADWFCHRASHIESTSGTRESVLHLVLFGEIAAAVLLTLFLRVNGLVLGLLGFAVAAHLLTSLRDTHFSQPRRHISPFEQLVHGFLDLLPLFAVVLLALLHAQEPGGPRFTPELRRPAPSPGSVLAVSALLGAALALILEELYRCRRHARAAAISALPAASTDRRR